MHLTIQVLKFLYHCLLSPFGIFFQAAFGIFVRQLHVHKKKKFPPVYYQRISCLVDRLYNFTACRRRRFFGFLLTIWCTWSLLVYFLYQFIFSNSLLSADKAEPHLIPVMNKISQFLAGYRQWLNPNLSLHNFNCIICSCVRSNMS